VAVCRLHFDEFQSAGINMKPFNDSYYYYYYYYYYYHKHKAAGGNIEAKQCKWLQRHFIR